MADIEDEGGILGVHLVLFQLLNFPTPPPATISIIFMITVGTSLWSVSNHLLHLVVTPSPLNLIFNTVEEFDFIVVGGGSAGSVVASRLSASGEHTVALVEAGGDPSILNNIPELAPYNLHQWATDWRYLIQPQTDACLSLEKRRLRWPRGKVLGGSSVLNFMMYQRGHPKDFDRWAELTGDPQWAFDNVLPFFKKSEDYHGNYPNTEFHGIGGPLSISKQSFQPTIDEWVEAGREMGFPSKTDPNGRQTAGFWPTDVTIWQGFRESTYRAFIKPALFRSNLRILRYSQVTQVDLDRNNRAVGVTYRRDGRTYSIRARKEVILSAGAIGTPQLLMLSGIGPKDHLQSVGITPKVNLPGVGQNLQDHVLTMFGPFLLDHPVSFLLDRDMNMGSAYSFARNRSGPFSSNEVSGIGFITTPGADDQTHPNIEFHQIPLGVRKSMADDFSRFMWLPSGLLREFWKNSVGKDANLVLVDLGRPLSRGTIQLESSDPFTHPLIDPKYFDRPEDLQAMVDALQFLVRFYEGTKAWQKHGARLLPELLPGCEHLTPKSNDYFSCYVRHLTLTIYHPCCTAKMGRRDDPMAVTDSNMRVRGVAGLRIADGSIMPEITNANLNAPIIMIGEKLAEILLEAWKEF